jgi:alpha-tubulin suppressor-like RCC1 family protein
MRWLFCGLLALSGCVEHLPVLERMPEPPPADKPCKCESNELCAVDHCVSKTLRMHLSVGVRHSCRIEDGELSCWGENRQGQLGLGDMGDHLKPTRVGDEDNWLEVAAGEEHTCAIAEPGRVYCWGNDQSGQLGLGGSGTQNKPMRVVSDFEDFEHIYAGGDSTCALRGGGALYCWGATGQLLAGTGDIVTPEVVDEPVIVLAGSRFTQVSIGLSHACAIRIDGALLCWGSNGDGQLGIGMATEMTQPPTVLGGDDWEWVAAGAHHTCGIRNDNLYCWGRGDSGELGLQNRRRTSAVSPQRVTDQGGWDAVDAGTNHTCAISARSQLWCWGRNVEGQLGMTPAAMNGAPTQIGVTRYSAIGLGETFTCAVDSGQALFCWGANDVGQLGTGDGRSQSTPTPVD